MWTFLGVAIVVIMGICGDHVASFFKQIHWALWRDK